MLARTSDSIEVAVMRLLCKRIRSEYSRNVLNTLDSNKYLSLDFEARSYSGDFRSLECDYLLYNLLRKWKGWDTPEDPDEVAFGVWRDSERHCYETNARLNTDVLPLRALRFISEVQRKIERLLGPCVPRGIFDECRWSGGATVSLRRCEASLAQKVSRTLTVTSRALRHLESVMDSVWLEALPTPSYEVVRGNRGVMVPKTAKVSRPIAAEPAGNAFLQQGVGRFLRRRLKTVGVNLDDQTTNQDAAFRALVDGLATIDLSSASDTLSVSVVRLLLPPSWYDLLFDLRSPTTTWSGSTYFLSKFSSMGNAFTFELESLIFWAISQTCVDQQCPGGFCTTYGDDIVVPQDAVPLLNEWLTFFGFVVNTTKSFSDGHFFESCGKHYCSLEDVTPAFQKEVVGRSLKELIRFHNRLYRWGVRTGLSHVVKDSLRLILERTRLVHPKLKVLPSVPEWCVSDLGFLSGSLRPRSDGDYNCLCLVEVPVCVSLIRNNEILGIYAYKLRAPTQYTSCLPDGRPGEIVSTGSLLRWQRVWRSSSRV